MARNSVSNTVIEASRVPLIQSIRLFGMKTYTLGTNFISWDTSNNYTLDSIAMSFGTRTPNAQAEVVGGTRDTGFACGGGTISAYDFGLLYSVFTAMVMAKVELGTSFLVDSEKLQRDGFYAVWFGNDGVVYSAPGNVIIPLKNADIETVCEGGIAKLNNFCSRDTYTLEREGLNFVLMTSARELLTFVKIPECVKKTYSMYFQNNNTTVDNPSTSWDEGSRLGQLIGETDSRSECMAVYEKYRTSPAIDSIIAREDLIVVPTERYADTKNFFGSICYTDKGEIAVAVNFRKGLFVYYPWFSQGDDRDIKVDPSAKFPAFFNVTEGCNHILRYAGTVVHRPLTAAKFDNAVFNSIKEAFLDMQLSRVPIQSAFGRVVIPESLLLQELTGGTGESLYCLLPVGVVGDKVVCMSSDGSLSTIVPSGWDVDSAFYDITEVTKTC